MSDQGSDTAGRTSSWRFVPSRARRLRKTLRQGAAYCAGWAITHAWFTAVRAYDNFGRGVDDYERETKK